MIKGCVFVFSDLQELGFCVLGLQGLRFRKEGGKLSKSYEILCGILSNTLWALLV